MASEQNPLAVAGSAHEHVAIIISADAHWPCVASPAASPAAAALIVGLTAAATSEGAA